MNQTVDRFNRLRCKVEEHVGQDSKKVMDFIEQAVEEKIQFISQEPAEYDNNTKCPFADGNCIVLNLRGTFPECKSCNGISGVPYTEEPTEDIVEDAQEDGTYICPTCNGSCEELDGTECRTCSGYGVRKH